MSLARISTYGVAALLLSCGGVAPDDQQPLGEVSQTEGEEGAISQRTPAFVTLTRDTRRCASPMCGGYWAQDVNRTTAAVYVSGLDWSETVLDDRAQGLVADAPTEVVILGRLGAVERRFNTRPLLVQDAWRGLPGVAPRATDRFYSVQANNPPITCITAPCNNLGARLVNTGRTFASFTALDVRTALVPFGDASWTVAQIEQHGALVAAHFEDGARLPGGRERLLVTSQVYVHLSYVPDACPLVRAAPCAAGQVYVSRRSEDRCLFPDGCAPAGQACLAFAPVCAEGYELASWNAAPTGCPSFACDPLFTLPVQEPTETPRCHHIRCAPGYHCENEGPEACVPNLTCASVLCAPGTRCEENNGSPMCVPILTCANALCAPGHRCVEANDTVTCEPIAWTSEAVNVASRNPYANNTAQSWLFTSDVAGSTRVRLVFTRFDLEARYDFVIVESAAGVELARYTGALGAFTSEEFEGSSLRIRFVTDGSVTRSGFAISTIDVR